MTHRLRRIELFTSTLAVAATLVALASHTSRPLGIALGGTMGLLDFVVIRRLATAALARRTAPARIVPLALGKSLALILIPATALLLPATLIDGVSFAVGVSALPLAIVIDALVPLSLERA